MGSLLFFNEHDVDANTHSTYCADRVSVHDSNANLHPSSQQKSCNTSIDLHLRLFSLSAFLTFEPDQFLMLPIFTTQNLPKHLFTSLNGAYNEN